MARFTLPSDPDPLRFLVCSVAAVAVFTLIAGCYVPMGGPSPCGPSVRCPQRFAEPQYPYLDADGTPRLRGEESFRSTVRDWTRVE